MMLRKLTIILFFLKTYLVAFSQASDPTLFSPKNAIYLSQGYSSFSEHFLNKSDTISETTFGLTSRFNSQKFQDLNVLYQSKDSVFDYLFLLSNQQIQTAVLKDFNRLTSVAFGVSYQLKNKKSWLYFLGKSWVFNQDNYARQIALGSEIQFKRKFKKLNLISQLYTPMSFSRWNYFYDQNIDLNTTEVILNRNQILTPGIGVLVATDTLLNFKNILFSGMLGLQYLFGNNYNLWLNGNKSTATPKAGIAVLLFNSLNINVSVPYLSSSKSLSTPLVIGASYKFKGWSLAWSFQNGIGEKKMNSHLLTLQRTW